MKHKECLFDESTDALHQVCKTFSLSLSTRKIQMCILHNAQLLTIHTSNVMNITSLPINEENK